MPVFGSQIDTLKIPIKNLVIEGSATAPTSPVAGQLWFDTSVNKPKCYINSSWVALDGSLATGILNMAGYKIQNLGTPATGTDAATKQYVDDMVQGLSSKSTVRAATTANITLSGTQTVDTVALAVGDRVLVKNQTTASANGIYVVASGAWTRALDFDSNAEVQAGAYFFVEEGSQADSGWVLTTDGAITIGTTSLAFVQFSGAGQITAGNGLTKSGNTLDVGAGTGITVAADTVGISPGGVSATELADSAVNLAGTKITGTLGVANGGTGQTTVAGIRTMLNASQSYEITGQYHSPGTWVTYTMPGTGMVNIESQFKFFRQQAGWDNQSSPNTLADEIYLDLQLDSADTSHFKVKSDVGFVAGELYIIVTGG